MASELRGSNASDSPQYSLRSLFITMTLLALAFALVGGVSAYLKRKQTEVDRLANLDKVTLAAIVSDVEAVRRRLGRAPKDQGELESLLGRSMPVVHDGGYPTPIIYHRTGDNAFLLQYTMWGSDDWIYDSGKPDGGWVQHYY